MDAAYYEEYLRAVMPGSAETLIKRAKQRASFMAWRRCSNRTKTIWYLWNPSGELSLPRPRLSVHGRALGYTKGVYQDHQRPPGGGIFIDGKPGNGPMKRWGK